MTMAQAVPAPWTTVRLEHVAEEVRAARELALISWAEGSIKLITALKRASDNMTPDRTLVGWLKERGFDHYNDKDLAALVGFIGNLETAREVFAKAGHNHSYRDLWEANKHLFVRKRGGWPKGKPRGPRKPRRVARNSMAEITRQIKLEGELSQIKGTSLDAPTEKDALIELKQLDGGAAARLVRHAAKGEAVSAAAEIDRRKFKPPPDADELMKLFSRNSHALLRAWVRATPDERRKWLKNMEENADGGKV